jgi:hypothetical protein
LSPSTYEVTGPSIITIASVERYKQKKIDLTIAGLLLSGTYKVKIVKPIAGINGVEMPLGAEYREHEKNIGVVPPRLSSATATNMAVRLVRNKYPDDEILVITTYAQLWEGNPNVDKVIPAKELEDFYSEYVLGHNVRFFKKHFVYDAIMDDAAVGTKCLPEFICKLYGAEYDGKPLDYFVAAKEKRTADVFMWQYKQFNKPHKRVANIYDLVFTEFSQEYTLDKQNIFEASFFARNMELVNG